jgi:hypothetical protein
MSLNNVLVVAELIKDEIFGIYDLCADCEYDDSYFNYGNAAFLATSLKAAIIIAMDIEHEYGPTFIFKGDKK